MEFTANGTTPDPHNPLIVTAKGTTGPPHANGNGNGHTNGNGKAPPVRDPVDSGEPTPEDVQKAATALRASRGFRVSDSSSQDAARCRTFGGLFMSILDMKDPATRANWPYSFVVCERTRNMARAEFIAKALDQAAAIIEAEPNDPRPDREADPGSFDLEIVDAQAFLDQEFAYAWLVKGVLVEGQPTIIGGAEKALKTSIAMDLAISLAITRPFLGKYFVPTAKRVLFLSGESGPATLQGNMREMLKSKKAVPAMLGDRLHMGFRLPMLTDSAHLDVVKSELDRVNPEVLIIDPIYLCMGGDESQFDPRNLFKVGAILRTIDRICTDRGVTLILVHHFRQRADPYTPPDLSDLSYAGFAQWLRQRIFLSRRSEYENDGMHLLLLDYGGSFGHQGRVEVDINAGVLDENFQGRKWEVTVRPMNEAINRKQEQREEQRTKQLTEKREEVSRTTESNAAEILNILKSWPRDRQPAVKNDVLNASKLSGANFNRALEHLRATEDVEVRSIPRIKSAGPKEIEAIYIRPKPSTLRQTPTDSDNYSDNSGLRDSDIHSDSPTLPCKGSRAKEECVSSERGGPETVKGQHSDKTNTSPHPTAEEGGQF